MRSIPPDTRSAILGEYCTQIDLSVRGSGFRCGVGRSRAGGEIVVVARTTRCARGIEQSARERVALQVPGVYTGVPTYQVKMYEHNK